MRVIAGTARGKRLKTPAGDHIRPTTDRVKESIFNIVQFEVPQSVCLDLFCGSGQMGVEAASRGARSCLMTDNDKSACALSLENVRACNLQDVCRVKCADYAHVLARAEQNGYDLVFLDPPYGGLNAALAQIYRFDILKVGGIIVCEGAAGEQVKPPKAPYRMLRDYKYGSTVITLITRD